MGDVAHLRWVGVLDVNRHFDASESQWVSKLVRNVFCLVGRFLGKAPIASDVGGWVSLLAVV
ncbi:hypothetical protein FHR38_000624 [Micromonospora polyrhachis]|uniref:Uncharacterized protein n=1 Tax=Micromonospora polyrhachis TaxID=1282883 RepID=A0A7W7SLZ0_9ACTN|nr:hypothetical protein [Micromonospora polyrhachis]